MTAKEGKVWGTTQALIRSPVIEVHKIIINKNGYCSQHTHQSKINAFYIISGELEVHRWKDYGLCDITILKAGELSVVPAGESHRFKAIYRTEALEIYWSELNHDDIQRSSVGGMNKEEEEGSVYHQDQLSIMGNLFPKEK
jgi:mannose-6-phosphate isomerase-like protein (cupin superfamily)